MEDVRGRIKNPLSKRETIVEATMYCYANSIGRQQVNSIGDEYTGFQISEALEQLFLMLKDISRQLPRCYDQLHCDQYFQADR